MEYSFYSLFPETFIRTIAKLTEKVYTSGSRATIYANEHERLNELDSVLWTFSTNSFVPHGTEKHDYQHVMLTTNVENANSSSVLILINNFDSDVWQTLSFKKLLFVFDTSLDSHSLTVHDSLKKGGYNAAYWKQTTKSWERVF